MPGETASRPLVFWFAGCATSSADMSDAIEALLAARFGNRHHQIVNLSCGQLLPSEKPSAVVAIPPTQLWSRARAASQFGPRPLRNRQWPWGVPDARGLEREQLESDNCEFRHCLHVLHRALQKNPTVALMFLHPEDRGGSERNDPASAWQIRELRQWANAQGLLRGAIFQCELMKDPVLPRPLRILSRSLVGGKAITSPFFHRG